MEDQIYLIIWRLGIKLGLNHTKKTSKMSCVVATLVTSTETLYIKETRPLGDRMRCQV